MALMSLSEIDVYSIRRGGIFPSRCTNITNVKEIGRDGQDGQDRSRLSCLSRRSCLSCPRLARRQRHGERRPSSRLAAHRRRAAMRFDDGLDETEAKAEPPLRPARVAAKPAIPDPPQLVSR